MQLYMVKMLNEEVDLGVIKVTKDKDVNKVILG